MQNNADPSPEEILQQIYAFVAEQMKNGTDKSSIVQELVSKGMEEEEATQFVEVAHAQILEAAQNEQLTLHSLVLAIAGGGIAAILGGVLWGWIAFGTGYEIGYVALGIGFICGFAVVLLSKGKKGVPFQIIALLTSILGIAVGKYTTFFFFFKEFVEKEYGLNAASHLTMFSGDTIQVFVESIQTGSGLSWLDITWIALAAISAWKIPQGLGIKLS